jgi:hypothetical protein
VVVAQADIPSSCSSGMSKDVRSRRSYTTRREKSTHFSGGVVELASAAGTRIDIRTSSAASVWDPCGRMVASRTQRNDRAGRPLSWGSWLNNGKKRERTCSDTGTDEKVEAELGWTSTTRPAARCKIEEGVQLLKRFEVGRVLGRPW